MKEHFNPEGRLHIYFRNNPKQEPRNLYFWNTDGCIFGKNIEDWNVDEVLRIEGSEDWYSYQPNSFLLADHIEKGWTVIPEWNFNNVPPCIYYIQASWEQNSDIRGPRAPGNIYTKKVNVEVGSDMVVDLIMSERIPEESLIENDLVKEVIIQSDTLTRWWGKPMYLKASVLLPKGYHENPGKAYPIRYDFTGSYTRLNRYWQEETFRNWWTSGDAPEMISVFTDYRGPFGNHFQMDSENSGPYGYAFIHELIPYIEKKYRNTLSPATRFLTGFSEGGWTALALQIFFPETFNGVASYSPDPVAFNKFFLINLYNDKNFYISREGLPRPLWRNTYGEVRVTTKDFIKYFSVFSPTNSCFNAGFAFDGWNAACSPKGMDGKPMQIFDEVTGRINPEVAEHWKKYDLLKICKTNWAELGRKLQGKIYIEVGDMDGPYLNVSVREFEKYMKETENPKSDAIFNFLPMTGHFGNSSQKKRIEKTSERLTAIQED